MGWEDRDYYREGGSRYSFGNLASFAALSWPFGTWFGTRVRIHFFLILSFVLILCQCLSGGVPLWAIATILGIDLGAILLHEFGHQYFAALGGGRHDEFTIWPAGGVTFPQMPPGAGPMFIGAIGGIAVNLAAALVAWLAAALVFHHLFVPPIDPLSYLSLDAHPVTGYSLPVNLLTMVFTTSAALVVMNLFPYYIFDGGSLLESALTPFFGSARAVNITCIVGMVLAVPIVLLGLGGGGIMLALFGVFLFISSYSHRKHYAPQSEYADGDFTPRRDHAAERLARAHAQKHTERQAQDRRDQAKIDKILEKVSAKGMISLTWLEKRTLRKATERQQKSDARRGYRSGRA